MPLQSCMLATDLMALATGLLLPALQLYFQLLLSVDHRRLYCLKTWQRQLREHDETRVVQARTSLKLSRMWIRSRSEQCENVLIQAVCFSYFFTQRVETRSLTMLLQRPRRETALIAAKWNLDWISPSKILWIHVAPLCSAVFSGDDVRVDFQGLRPIPPTLCEL